MAARGKIFMGFLFAVLWHRRKLDEIDFTRQARASRRQVIR
jgi:hypothetical protein